MSKLCKSCGQYYDGEYCDKCGYGNPDIKTKADKKYKKATKPKKFQTEEDKALYAEWEAEKNQGKPAPRDSKAGIKVLIIAIVVAVCLVLYMLVKAGVIFTGSKTGAIEKNFKSVQTENYDDFISCFPSEIKKDYEADRKESGLDKKAYMSALYKDFRDIYGEGYKINVSFGNEKKLDKDEYNLKEYKAQYGSTPDISEVWEITAKLEFSGSKQTDEVSLYICVGKCSGQWKILSIPQ